MRSRFFYPHVSSPAIARPRVFAFTPGHPLWKGCKFFAGGSNPGGTRAEDSSPHRNHGTLINGASYQRDIRRSCIQALSASSQYVSLSANGLPSGATDRTVALFMNPTSIADAWGGPLWYGTTANEQGFAISWYSTSRVVTVGRYGSNASASNTTLFPLGQWSHFSASVASGTAVSYFFNGFPDGTATIGALNTVLSSFQIGRVWNSTSQDYDGLIADLGIWSRILTARELSVLANRSDAMLDGALYDPHKTSVGYGISQTIRLSPWLIRRRRRNAGAR